MKRWLGVLTVLLGLSSLLGCNTIQGVGKDIKKGGEAIERAAK